MKHLSLTIKTTSEAADIVSLILMEEGSEGVSILDPKDIEFVKQNVYWDYMDDKLADSQDVLVSGFFDNVFDLNIIKKRLEELKNNSQINVGSLEIKSGYIDSTDYENEWKKYFDVIEYEKIAIVPNWLTYNGSKPAIYLANGKAFGTGNHESTSLCLTLMQELDFTDKSVLDIGCGSGILGLSAAKMGAKNVLLTDIDPLAVEEATNNALANCLTDKVEIKQQSFADGFVADILLANLTADLLISLRQNIDKLVLDNGYLIISGIINERAKEVKDSYSSFKEIKNLKKGEWQAFLFKKV